ncbi:MAG: type I glyceraldehyde-3-phosphate dehydrogenase [Candidatus Pacebacteria bacterium]|nr:type I glyceraldehyde-3-phosphate dehydrogenase [Candidatus Paceibacterota bacterium]NUQ56981.1 type I glyceraldehyde-3-phosphate dehydrogenase [Candidatus Paceibacter sp.]
MKIAINGFGRIGRILYRQASANKNFDIVAVNDLADRENLTYLLEHDSVYGKFELPEYFSRIKFFQEKDTSKLPWGKLDVDVVVESTGFFDSYEKSEPHLNVGAKRVVITAPVKDDKTLTFTPEVCSKDIAKFKITSNASCTTNAVTPVLAILDEELGIKSALLNTVHAYTATQGIVDRPDARDWRRGRAGALNISPSSTGAAVAAAKALPEMEGRFDGVAVRVPVPSGSLADITFISGRETSAEEVNKILAEKSLLPRWNGIIKVSNEQIVSSDIVGEPYGSIVDAAFTRVASGNLVKVLSWYDNEYGYAAMLVKHLETLKKYL